MALFGPPDYIKCCCPGCPCCPGWPGRQSGTIEWTSIPEASNDCEGSPELVFGGTTEIGCSGAKDPIGTLIRQAATYLYVRLYCELNTETGEYEWTVEYRSAISGGTFEPPASDDWAVAEGVNFVCPDCLEAVDGIATGTVDFIAVMACETSGGVTSYNVLVHGDVYVGCP